MSGNDQNDDKGFLARWSQRKREAKQPDREMPAAEASPPLESVTGSEAEPEFDLSSLPKLDDLTGTTDITAFLRKGVPEHLRNAALRKSWALDPAIRNYVNPALDYAWLLHGPFPHWQVDDELRRRARFYHRLEPWVWAHYGLLMEQPERVRAGLAEISSRL